MGHILNYLQRFFRGVQRRPMWLLGFTLVLGLSLVRMAWSEESNAVDVYSPIEYFGVEPRFEDWVVEPGQTLWSISEAVLGKPELWPKVWVLNNELTNPNWIYPGQVIRFYRADLDLPSQYDYLPHSLAQPDSEEEEEEFMAEEPLVELIQTVTPDQVKRRSDWRAKLFVGLFVTPFELQEAGTIIRAAHERELLQPGDEIFVRFPFLGEQPRGGKKYLIYETVRQVKHPITREDWGYMTRITGLATVTDRLNANTLTAVLDRSVLAVERGHLVSPMRKNPLAPIEPKASAKIVEGYILALQYDSAEVVGTGQLAFIDKGLRDGLEQGDRIYVYSPSDPLMSSKGIMKWKTSAEMIIVDAKETASTCLVIKAEREVVVGQIFKTRPPSKAKSKP
ncbi:MAG: LysM peptidoglycan-binding domain-containing protein [Myxococcota bacterium]|jgi:hypothetical protein|nr:LysM peptidoglycan-binding domain-containing protein [Myxococcota bacterium]